LPEPGKNLQQYANGSPLVHRIFRSRGQNLLSRDQGTIHIGGQQSDSGARLPVRSVLFFIERWALDVPRSGFLLNTQRLNFLCQLVSFPGAPS
jgi:hypothetical protein